MSTDGFRLPDDAVTAVIGRLVDALFERSDQFQAKRVLATYGDNEAERVQMAALKCSEGDLAKLRDAINLAQVDYRDALMAADFGDDTRAHLRWSQAVLAADGEKYPWKRAQEDPIAWADAWITYSIYSCGKGGGELHKVLGMADAVNHALPNIEEIEHAVNRLLAADWLSITDTGVFRLSPEARSHLRRVEKRDRDLMAKLRKISLDLPPDDALEPPWRLAAEGFRTAMDEYSARFDRTLKRLRIKDR